MAGSWKPRLRVLDRFAVDAESRLVDVPALGGQARVLVAGDGPAVVMLTGAGPPAAIWAPLMAELTGLHPVCGGVAAQLRRKRSRTRPSTVW